MKATRAEITIGLLAFTFASFAVVRGLDDTVDADADAIGADAGHAMAAAKNQNEGRLKRSPSGGGSMLPLTLMGAFYLYQLATSGKMPDVTKPSFYLGNILSKVKGGGNHRHHSSKGQHREQQGGRRGRGRYPFNRYFDEGRAEAGYFDEGQAKAGYFDEGQAKAGYFDEGQAKAGYFDEGQAKAGYLDESDAISESKWRYRR